MDFKLPYSKELWLAVEISQLLYKYNCTYNESDEILKLVTAEIKQQREELEYDDFDDFMKRNKTYIADNDVITPLNHVKGVC